MLRLLPAAFLLVALVGCDTSSAQRPDPVPLQLTPADKAFVGQSNAFGVELFARTAAGEPDNLMLSPLSASTALTMLLNGADGETFAQIRDVLGYPPALDVAAVNASARSLRTQLLAADPQVQLALANAVFHDAAYPVHGSFLAAMQAEFGAPATALDFRTPAALDAINGWASRNTNGRVPRVLDALDPDLVVLLMDALYFKGDWTERFDAARTAPGAFTLADGSTVQVPTMGATVPARLAHGAGFAALELPYGRRNFSMVVVVPKAPLADFVSRLDAARWNEITAALGDADAWSPTLVSLPRFRFDTDRRLNEPLQALGMVDAFDARADLSRMGPGRLEVSFVKQNTFVEVNEQGTEAAAVTTIGMELRSIGPHVFVNRPFVFAIRERTSGTILFIGQVTNPAR